MPKGVYRRPSLEERLWAGGRWNGDCLEWTGRLRGLGYGTLNERRDGKLVGIRVHRLAYELTFGPIPEGMIVRHKCDNPACFNPEHLELGTALDNASDRDTRGRNYRLRRTECPQGHPYDETNTGRKKSGHRYCRACNRARVAAYRQLSRAA